MGFDPEKSKLNVEQAGNYIHSPEFDKNSRKKIKTLKENSSQDIMTASQSARNRLLRIGVAMLGKDDKEGLYKKVLLCRLHGATHIQMAAALKVPIMQIQILEQDAIKCVKDKLHKQKITPVISAV